MTISKTTYKKKKTLPLPILISATIPSIPKWPHKWSLQNSTTNTRLLPYTTHTTPRSKVHTKTSHKPLHNTIHKIYNLHNMEIKPPQHKYPRHPQLTIIYATPMLLTFIQETKFPKINPQDTSTWSSHPTKSYTIIHQMPQHAHAAHMYNMPHKERVNYSDTKMNIHFGGMCKMSIIWCVKLCLTMACLIGKKKTIEASNKAPPIGIEVLFMACWARW